MTTRLKPLSEQVMVITGASSGIGLTTARMAAQKGARLVLAARGEDALRALQEEIQRAGGHAVYVVTDVTREQDVNRLAERAIQEFGGFDTWVNDAGISVFGKIVDVPVEDERKLFDVNFWGMVYGSKTAVAHLKTRGGALINLGSVASDRGLPLQASYSASKHAVKAYTDALRTELEKEGAPVSVTLIKPTAIDTPFFRHAKTYMQAQPSSPPPMYAPEAVAKAILSAAEKPIRDVLVGGMAPLQSKLGLSAPKVGDVVMKAQMFEGQMSRRAPEPGDNQVFEHPSNRLQERGGYEIKTFERSTYTEAVVNPVFKRVAVGAGLALAALLIAKRRQAAA